MLMLCVRNGFTLIEVMAAVAVFAISATGLYGINQQSVFVAERLENKTFAQWLAQNEIAEFEMHRVLPAVGSESNRVEMVGSEWKVTRKVQSTSVETVNKVIIEVSLNDGPALAVLESYIGQRTPEALSEY